LVGHQSIIANNENQNSNTTAAAEPPQHQQREFVPPNNLSATGKELQKKKKRVHDELTESVKTLVSCFQQSIAKPEEDPKSTILATAAMKEFK
jgi:hypothetical protein